MARLQRMSRKSGNRFFRKGHAPFKNPMMHPQARRSRPARLHRGARRSQMARKEGFVMPILLRLMSAALAVVWAVGAAAQDGGELKIGLSAEPSAMDPHFHNLTPNNSLLKHIFDRLIDQDETQRIAPMLATSWRTTDEKTWEFKLRAGVKFTDGSDFSANDVIYSFCRAPRVENSPS